MSKVSLRNHIVEHHGDKSVTFKCALCPFEGKNLRCLKGHLKTHETEKKYACNFVNCDYVGKAKHLLLLHKKAHNALKPLACELCDYTCALKSRLDAHKLTHTEKKLKCDICDYTTNSSVKLVFHKKRHQDPSITFKCDLCAFTTPYRESIRNHEATHKPEKPFKCEFPGCDYAAKTKAVLRGLTKKKHVESCVNLKPRSEPPRSSTRDYS